MPAQGFSRKRAVLVAALPFLVLSGCGTRFATALDHGPGTGGLVPRDVHGEPIMSAVVPPPLPGATAR